MRQYTNDFEPAAAQPFDDVWERKLTSVQQVKGTLNCKYVAASATIYGTHEIDNFSFISGFWHFVTEEMHKFITEQLQTGRVPLCINPQSAAFKSFAR